MRLVKTDGEGLLIQRASLQFFTVNRKFTLPTQRSGVMSVARLSKRQLEDAAEEYGVTVDDLKWTAKSLKMSVAKLLWMAESTGVHIDNLGEALDFVGDL